MQDIFALVIPNAYAKTKLQPKPRRSDSVLISPREPHGVQNKWSSAGNREGAGKGRVYDVGRLREFIFPMPACSIFSLDIEMLLKIPSIFLLKLYEVNNKIIVRRKCITVLALKCYKRFLPVLLLKLFEKLRTKSM